MNQCHIGELLNNNFEFLEEEKTAKTVMESSVPPEIPLRSQLDSMSLKVITGVTRQNNVDNIVHLNLFNNKIRKLENLHLLSSLQTLNMSFNQIEEISGLHRNS